MPISDMGGIYTKDHWVTLKRILTEAVESIAPPKFYADLVSSADETAVIQRTIVQNLNQAPIVICVVSARNPNVMFELGLRLAWGEWVVIVKDEQTTNPFDINPLEYVEYPSDLNYDEIVTFKETLAKKVRDTHEASLHPRKRSPFMEAFGPFKSATPIARVVPSFLQALGDLDRRAMARLAKIERLLDDRPSPDAWTEEVAFAEACERLKPIVAAQLEKQRIENPRSMIGNQQFSHSVSLQHNALKSLPSPKELRKAINAVLLTLANGHN